ncbi:hypothetical protein IX51_06850 [uncultured archaeon]|nr:hypothetical protein IX51_06850 [uncultured archaeon]
MAARNILAGGISSFFILLYMVVVLNVGYVYIDQFARQEVIMAFIVAMALPVLAMIPSRRLGKAQFYLELVVLLYTYGMAMLAIQKPVLLFIALVPFIINLLLFQSRFLTTGRQKYKAVTFVALLVFMYFVSSVIKVEIPGVRGYEFAIALYDDNISPQGIQFIMTGAITLFTKLFVIDLSVGDFLLFITISAILTENYSMIFTYLKSRNKGMVNTTLSGAVTALSCQCESLAAAFPTVIVLLLSVIIVPLMVETVGSIILTSFLLSRLYLRGRGWGFVHRVEEWSRGNGFLKVMILPYLVVPLFETFGIFLGFLNIFMFFAGINFLMFFTGISIPVVIKRVVGFRGFSSRLPLIGLTALSAFLMYVWFLPSLTLVAYTSPAYFAVMNLSAVASGFLSGVAYASTRSHENRRLLLEFITMMESMFAIIVFYISVVGRYTIWPEFGLLQATEFAIAMFGVTLPFMWMSTHMTLSDYAVDDTPTKVRSGRNDAVKA